MGAPFDREPPGGGRFDEAGDATRRTHLANERTFLAWWRTGLAAFAVALAVGGLLPDLLDGETRWPYLAIGVVYAIVGVILVLYALWRQREVERAVQRGGYARPSPFVLVALTLVAAGLGVTTALLILLEP